MYGMKGMCDGLPVPDNCVMDKIELNVHPYCHECFDFKPLVISDVEINDNDTKLHFIKHIICEHDFECDSKKTKAERFLEKQTSNGMIICTKCGKIASYNSYFGKYICGYCGWTASAKDITMQV